MSIAIYPAKILAHYQGVPADALKRLAAALDECEASSATGQIAVDGPAGAPNRGAMAAEHEYADASIELAEKARARAAADGIPYAKAMGLALIEDSGLQRRYDEFCGRGTTDGGTR